MKKLMLIVCVCLACFGVAGCTQAEHTLTVSAPGLGKDIIIEEITLNGRTLQSINVEGDKETYKAYGNGGFLAISFKLDGTLQNFSSKVSLGEVNELGFTIISVMGVRVLYLSSIHYQ